MALVIHAAKTNRNAFKALITAEYAGVEVKWAENFEMGVSNKTPKFLKMNPIGKVPVLETPDGSVFESNAIARYVARDTPLMGSSPYEMGQMEQWIDFSTLELDVEFHKCLCPRCRKVTPVQKEAIFRLKRALGALNTHHLTSDQHRLKEFIKEHLVRIPKRNRQPLQP